MVVKYLHFAFDKENGTLTFINKQLTGGDHPCYVDIDKTGKWVFAGNYSSGSLSVSSRQYRWQSWSSNNTSYSIAAPGK